MNLFKQYRWFYLPESFAGLILYLVAIAVDLWFFVAIDRNSHSASDTLINFLPYFTSVWVFFSFLAAHTSKKKQ